MKEIRKDIRHPSRNLLGGHAPRHGLHDVAGRVLAQHASCRISYQQCESWHCMLMLQPA